MKVKEKGFFSWISKSGRFEVDQLDTDLEAVLDYYAATATCASAGTSAGMRWVTAASIW